MPRLIVYGLAVFMAPLVVGCSSDDYSPDIYAVGAVQKANKVERGVVVGYREVSITTDGTVGAVSGGAAGGVLGAQVGQSSLDSSLGGVVGTAVGGLVGTVLEHAVSDTTGWEYIVRQANGDLVSVTQKEPKPLPIGQKVLVITGSQARIIPDYLINYGTPSGFEEKTPPPPGQSDKAKGLPV